MTSRTQTAVLVFALVIEQGSVNEQIEPKHETMALGPRRPTWAVPVPSKAPTPCGRCVTQSHLPRPLRHPRPTAGEPTGTTTERRYDTHHKQLRDQWKARIDRGELVICAKPGCGKPIIPGQPFDLGHDENRSHRGPEHQACNRATKHPATTKRAGGMRNLQANPRSDHSLGLLACEWGRAMVSGQPKTHD
jgi:hypothetical protein